MTLTNLMDQVQKGNWVIKKVIQGYNGKIRINAETRFYNRGQENFFCEWFSKDYVNRVRKNLGMGPITITNY